MSERRTTRTERRLQREVDGLLRNYFGDATGANKPLLGRDLKRIRREQEKCDRYRYYPGGLVTWVRALDKAQAARPSAPKGGPA